VAQLVMVSNRVGLPGKRSAAGGLSVALLDVLRKHGKGLWFGWSGNVSDKSSREPNVIESGGVTYVTADLGRADYNSYYAGYSNGALWPLLHYRLGLVDYKRRAYEGYQRVNGYLAGLLAPFLGPDDDVWVHDYHLIPFASELRARGARCRIGFFLHTPFPSPEVFSALPHHEKLMATFLDYDLVGMQTTDDVGQFLDYIGEVAGGRASRNGMFEAFGKRSRAAAFPIGIDTEGFSEIARTSGNSPEAVRLKKSLAGRDFIIGVDRLDYSKALPNRFEAIEALLSDWPTHRGKFSYLQVAPVSRADVVQYQELKRKLEGAAGRVNGKFAEFDWSPIRYVNRSFSRPTLAAFYRQARVGLVTPFRDGMNLVAKEFVAAQDPQDPGVLILSRFAGAACELQSALLINPFDIDALASALHQSLEMPLDERQARWTPMMATLKRNTIWRWRDSFLAALTESQRTRLSA
jgi:trehalose 6-phosphate synthase